MFLKNTTCKALLTFIAMLHIILISDHTLLTTIAVVKMFTIISHIANKLALWAILTAKYYSTLNALICNRLNRVTVSTFDRLDFISWECVINHLILIVAHSTTHKFLTNWALKLTSTNVMLTSYWLPLFKFKIYLLI